MRNIFTTVILFVFLDVNAQAVANTSAYTKLNLEKDCKFTQSDDLGGSAICKGYKQFQVHFAEGDLRQMVQFGEVDQPFTPWQSFSEFNRINNVIEWRLDGSKPVATILRWFVENHDEAAGQPTKKTEGQVLVISTVGNSSNPRSCVVGYVDARENSEANSIARGVADNLAPSFQCGEDPPKFHGIRGPYAGNPTALFE